MDLHLSPTCVIEKLRSSFYFMAIAFSFIGLLMMVPAISWKCSSPLEKPHKGQGHQQEVCQEQTAVTQLSCATATHQLHTREKERFGSKTLDLFPKFFRTSLPKIYLKWWNRKMAFLNKRACTCRYRQFLQFIMCLLYFPGRYPTALKTGEEQRRQDNITAEILRCTTWYLYWKHQTSSCKC